jgi:hypothetical protein
VLIEADETPRSALPVRERQIFVVPMRQVRIDAVEPQMISFAPGATIVLQGSGLLDDDTIVQFGTIEQTPAAGSTPIQVTAALPAGLRAGANIVKVIHRLPLGAADPRARKSMASNIATFVLRPRLNSASFSDDGDDPRITVAVEPQLGLQQQATLLLHQVIAPPAQPLSYTLPPRPRDAEADPLVFDAADLSSGSYLVRLRVDGAESELIQQDDETQPNYRQFTGPTVVIP